MARDKRVASAAASAPLSVSLPLQVPPSLSHFFLAHFAAKLKCNKSSFVCETGGGGAKQAARQAGNAP